MSPDGLLLDRKARQAREGVGKRAARGQFKVGREIDDDDDDDERRNGFFFFFFIRILRAVAARFQRRQRRLGRGENVTELARRQEREGTKDKRRTCSADMVGCFFFLKKKEDDEGREKRRKAKS